MSLRLTSALCGCAIDNPAAPQTITGPEAHLVSHILLMGVSPNLCNHCFTAAPSVMLEWSPKPPLWVSSLRRSLLDLLFCSFFLLVFTQSFSFIQIHLKACQGMIFKSNHLNFTFISKIDLMSWIIFERECFFVKEKHTWEGIAGKTNKGLKISLKESVIFKI